MAFGDITLTAAMRANLVSLQSTDELLGRTQERLATGKRVNSAIDNPTNFFAARGHAQRADLLTGLKDTINEAVQTVKAADKGVTSINSLIETLRGTITQVRNALAATTSAQEIGGTVAPGGTGGLVAQYNELIRQINNTQRDTHYKGVNFLGGTSVTLTVNFNETASSTLTMSGFDGTAAGLGISGGQVGVAVGNITYDDLDTNSELANIEVTLNNALATLRTQSGTLAANVAILSVRQKFIVDIVNTLSEGATKLTVADTNEEGANMLLLQTRQQLGTTALSLSAEANSSVLRLF